MSSVFGSGYANAYDSLYGDKDYPAECNLIERVLREYGTKPLRSILDLGCGTGNHALPLAGRGYEVVGIDRSNEMLAQVRDKESSTATFQAGDIRWIDLRRKFDSALMMFAVLGYQLENKDVLAALKTARGHLNAGGILLFDIWYGPAVLHIRPAERARVIPTAEGEVVRIASGTLDIAHHLCVVNYLVWRMKGDIVVARVEEKHQMRYFFPLEIDLLLESAGFTRLRIGGFPELEREPDETTWNVMVVAKAVE